MFLENTEQLNKKLESCELKNMQMAVLQREIMVLKLKDTMHERTIKEKEAHCKQQDELYAEVSSISRHMRELSAETKNEGKLRNEMQRQINEYRDIIEKKNKYIRVLRNHLDKNKHITEDVTEGLSYNTEDEILENIEPEKYVWPSENSCLTVNDTSKILMIKVPHIEPFSVPCDGTIAGPGWTVIQRRVDDSVDFNRKWDTYKNGFGDLNGNLFIGLEKLHRMTNSQPHELYIHLQNFRGETRYAHYKNFSIGGEDEGYSLKLLLDYSGDAGDSLQLNRNMKFSTYDRDNDESFDNCAAARKGGWWYNQCSRA